MMERNTFMELTNMHKILALLSLIMVIALTSGCANTAEGAGRDVENMGQWMQDTF